jgi:signal transduction histidine kinase
MGLFGRYLISFCLIATLISALGGAVLLSFIDRTAVRHVEQIKQLETDLVRVQITTALKGLESAMAAHAALPWHQDQLHINDRITEFRRLLAQFDQAIDIELLNQQGKRLLLVSRSSTPRFEGDSRYRELAQQAIQQKRLVYGTVAIDSQVRKPFFAMALADQSSSGQITVLRVSTEKLAGALATIWQGKAQQSFIAQQDGTVIAHADRLKVSKDAREFGYGGFDIRVGSASTYEVSRSDGMFVSSVQALADPPWFFVTETPTHIAQEPRRRALSYTLWLLAVGLTIAIASSWWLARRLSEPIISIANAAQLLAQGQLDHRVQVKGAEEVALLGENFNRMATELQSLTQDLEARIQAKTQLLELEFSQKQTHLAEIASLEERGRLMRDLHDSVGGHLVALLAVSKQANITPNELASLVQDTLIEFRIAIDSLSPHQHDLITALANLKFRIQPRVLSAGLRLTSQLDDLPDNVSFSQSEIFHVLRIATEAITNALKHATGASEIRLNLLWDDVLRIAQIEVADNGQLKQMLTDLQGSQRGRGIANMRHRAAQLGASIEFLQQLPQGLRVVLKLRRGA